MNGGTGQQQNGGQLLDSLMYRWQRSCIDKFVVLLVFDNKAHRVHSIQLIYSKLSSYLQKFHVLRALREGQPFMHTRISLSVSVSCMYLVSVENVRLVPDYSKRRKEKFQKYRDRKSER